MPHAEIAGAGIGGLTLATALCQRGWSVHVHERAAQLRDLGIGMSEHTQRLAVTTEPVPGATRTRISREAASAKIMGCNRPGAQCPRILAPMRTRDERGMVSSMTELFRRLKACYRVVFRANLLGQTSIRACLPG